MNTTTIFKLANGQQLEFIASKQINPTTTEITLFKPIRGAYVKKEPEQMKQRGRPYGSKTKKAPHIIDNNFREAVNLLDPSKKGKVVALFTEMGLDYYIDQIVAPLSSIPDYEFL